MKSKIALMALCLLALISAPVNAHDMLSGIKGNLAGQVVDIFGFGNSIMSVSLIDFATGCEVQYQSPEKLGNFFFREIEPGRYAIKLCNPNCQEVRADVSEFEIRPGRTATVLVTIANPKDPRSRAVNRPRY